MTMYKLKVGETVVLTEDQILEAIKEFIAECDCDDLATLVSHMFGGECYYKIEEDYEFTPNENYGGAFDD